MVKENKKAFKSEGELFRNILGKEWFKLHPEIRKRFDKSLTISNPLKYCGVMDEISCSFWGKLLGYMSKIFIKGALIPYTAFNVPVDVEVYSQENYPYIIKNRIYKLPGRKLLVFNSCTQESDKGEVLEYAGFGIGMKMLVFEKNRNLHFKSNAYFIGFLWQNTRPPFLRYHAPVQLALILF